MSVRVTERELRDGGSALGKLESHRSGGDHGVKTDLGLGDLEQVRLILRGGSVIDWRRLRLSSERDCEELLSAHGLDLHDPADRDHLASTKQASLRYIRQQVKLAVPPEVMAAESTCDLMLMASAGSSARQRSACMVLKIMHLIHVLKARELMAHLAATHTDLYGLVERKVERVVRPLAADGSRVLEFTSSRKNAEALITKLLTKRTDIRAHVFDMVRFRIVTRSPRDVVPVVFHLSRHLFPFDLTVPGESRNTLFDFPSLLRSRGPGRGQAQDLQIPLDLEDEMRNDVDQASSGLFRTVKFVAHIPLRVGREELRTWAAGRALSPGVVHVPSEFQILDVASHARNEIGEASHERYEARRIETAKRRLLLGRSGWEVPRSP
jgi:uncharacterized protein (TIGR04552 family)